MAPPVSNRSTPSGESADPSPASDSASPTENTDGQRSSLQDETLLEERNLLESIFNTSAAAITVLNADGEIVQANARAEEVLGLSPRTLEGRTYDDPRWQHETVDGEPFPNEKQPFVQVMQTEAPVYDVQLAITWPNGRRRILSVDGAPLRDDDGTVTGAVFLVDDITERKRREQALREEHDRFETLGRIVHRFRTGEAPFVRVDGWVERADLQIVVGFIR